MLIVTAGDDFLVNYDKFGVIHSATLINIAELHGDRDDINDMLDGYEGMIEALYEENTGREFMTREEFLHDPVKEFLDELMFPDQSSDKDN